MEQVDVITVEETGTIVFPEEIRKQLALETDDSFKVLVTNNNILLRKIDSQCVFCGDEDDTVRYRDKVICKECLEKMTLVDKE